MQEGRREMFKTIKYVLSVLLALSISLCTVSTLFAAGPAEPTIKELAAQNGVSEAEFTLLVNQWQKAAQDVAKSGPVKYAKNQQDMKDLFRTDPESAAKLYYRQSPQSSAKSNNALLRGSELGLYGDVLVTYGKNTATQFFGHAAIVSEYNVWTIESWPLITSPIDEDGVQWYTNDWASYSQTYGLEVYNATDDDYYYASMYAEYQLGKLYNWNWLDKNTTSYFYCSQLAWRSWLQQGFNLDSYPSDTVVMPAELVTDGDVYIFYYRN
jgi:uncharacterized protein YycO